MTDRSHRLSHGARSGLVALCVALLSTSSFSEAGVSVFVDDERVRVVAAGATRKAILEALAAQGMLDVVSAQSLDQRIDFDGGPMTLGELLQRLLRQHSYMYVRQPGTDRLWILAAGDARATGWQATSNDSSHQVRLDLTDSDPEVRMEAVLTAADLTPATATQLLVPVTFDPAPAVREAAEAVLEDLGATEYLLADRLTE